MPILKRNVDLGPAIRLSSFRKIAMGTWRTAGDPSVYGLVELDATAALAYLARLHQKYGVKLSLTHFTGKAVGEVLKRYPDINVLRRGSKLYPRRTIDLFFQIASDIHGQDLSGAVVREADRKGILAIGRELTLRASAVREKGDPEYRKMKNKMKLLPAWMVRYALAFSEWFTYGLNLWTPLLGTPRDPFGSVMITSIGSLGLDEAYAPLVPYSRVPLLIAVGAVRERAVVRDGKVVIAPMLKLCATFDHRYIDGMYASRMVKSLQEVFADPEALMGPAEA